jgi:hypothetical protein
MPFDGLASALLTEEGWVVLSNWLEPTLGGGSGEPNVRQRQWPSAIDWSPRSEGVWTGDMGNTRARTWVTVGWAG